MTLEIQTMRGILNTHYWNKDNMSTMLSRHELNLSSKFGSTFSESWFNNWTIDSWKLRNGVAEHLSHTYSDQDFRQSNEGISFLAYFPVTDFRKLLRDYTLKVYKHKAKVMKRRLLSSLNSLKTNITGNEAVTITLGLGGPTFSTPRDFLRAEEEALDYARINKDYLNKRIQDAIEEWERPYVILQRGFGLAETPEGDENSVELFLLGDKENTETLVDKLNESPGEFPETIAELFRPRSPSVDYNIWINTLIGSEGENSYSEPRFTEGTYEPFQNMKEIKIFDYRQTKLKDN